MAALRRRHPSEGGSEILTLASADMDELVRHRALYWGGDWHAPQAGRTFGSVDPSNGDDLGAV
ncbi:hypothetical protein ATO2_19015, partial [Roseovarius sp. 22II1-1F6A]